jgi:hypothetical protein
LLNPKAPQRQHWEEISDEDLLSTELTTENPLGVVGLVDRYPEGEDEPHVEFSYDLRGTGADEFKCVHGSHGHLKGFVFRKGDARYLVGWKCGESLYGTKFDAYTADHKAAVTRQSGLRRLEDLRKATIALSAWASSPDWDGAMSYYEELRNVLWRDMPFVYDTLAASAGQKLKDVQIPRFLCSEEKEPAFRHRNDIASEHHRMMAEISAVLVHLAKPNVAALALIGKIVESLRGIARRADLLVTKLEEVKMFFQPAVLGVISDLADRARPRRAPYHAGLLSLTTKKITVRLPETFRVPPRSGVEALQTALNSAA